MVKDLDILRRAKALADTRPKRTVYVVNVNNCMAYSDYHEGNQGVYSSRERAVAAMTERGFDPKTRLRHIPWGGETYEEAMEEGWYSSEEYRIEEWEVC